MNCFSTLPQSSTASIETFNYKQALQELDYHKFVIATKGCDPMPGAKVIMSIWSLKPKQYLDGTMNKHKAHLCVHGGMRTWGQNHWKAYAPVVNRASVCILLVVAKIHALSSKSIDFILAFPQADLEIPGFIKFPLGFDATGSQSRKHYVLQLNKSV